MLVGPVTAALDLALLTTGLRAKPLAWLLFKIAHINAYVTACKPVPIAYVVVPNPWGKYSLYCTNISFACKGCQIILGYILINVKNSGLRYLVEALPKGKRAIAKTIAEAKSFSGIIK